MVQWLRILLSTQGTQAWVLSLPQEDSNATEQLACAPRVLSPRAATTKAYGPRHCALQQENPPQ